MNGLVFGSWLTAKLEADMTKSGIVQPGPYAHAHNVGAKSDGVRASIPKTF